ncbi:antibiotic biosynthesis monooxygenase [Streptomyces sp. NPDC048442]|uniref:antibiotic biosynthesis monooxygenase n=1 Tax=Streptomyces sp. NPDC048442 TaxID=3154823 RepID=UPI003422374F
MAAQNTPPEAGRPHAGTQLISEWIVDTPERQRAAADALLGEWRALVSAFRPAAFLRLACFASDDGRVLLSHAQWAGDEAHLAFVRTHRSDMIGRIDKEVPGIQRPGLTRYTVAHSLRLDSGDARTHTGDAGTSSDAGTLTLVRARTGIPEVTALWAAATAERVRRIRPAGVRTVRLLGSKDGTHGLLLVQGPWPANADDTRPADGAHAGVHLCEPRGFRLIGSVEGP